MAKRRRTKPGHAKRDDGCTCECDACPDDCSNCDHEGCDAEEEDCGPDCPMAMRRMTREIPALALRASVAPGTLDEEKRTVELIWTTGERVLRGFFDRYFEELSLAPGAVRMGRLQNGAPLLDTHDSYDLRGVIGVVESARLEPTRGIAKVRFARDDQGNAVFAKVRDGILRNVSVGYRIHKMEKVEDGEDRIPVYRAVDWEPYEISIVPVGADAGAGIRAAGAATNPCEFIAEERTMAKLLKKDPQGSTTKPAEVAATRGDVDETEGVDEAEGTDETRASDETIRLGERSRVMSIQRSAKVLRLKPGIAEEHIAKGTSADKFRELAERLFEKEDPIDITPAGDGATTIRAGADERDKFLRGASDWIVERAAVGDMVSAHAKTRGEAGKVDGGEFRGMRMLDLARMCLERAGVKTRGMLPMNLIAAALDQRAAIGVGAASTGDFPVLLENTLHKVLLAAYATTPDTWTQWCMTGSVSDFRPHKRLRMGSFGSLQTVNEGGEFANKSIPDATKESITAATKGNMISITRQALINDDLSAFNQLATMLGRAARLSIEVDAYNLLALNAGLGPVMNDGLTLFHATHNNISTGAALTASAIDADRVKMAQQTDPSGNEILDLRPSVLVIPIGLGGLARQINNGQYDFDASNKFQIPNKVLGLFQGIVDTPRLSGTRRYIFASPSIAPTVEVAFLDGQQQPFMEQQMGFRIDALEWKVRLDYAVGGIDFRGAITNAGA